jgi:hypothetical protein
MTRLTKAQQRLVHELGELTKELGFDPTPLMEAGETGAQVSASLDLARRNRIAAAVVSDHTFVDHLLRFRSFHTDAEPTLRILLRRAYGIRI